MKKHLLFFFIILFSNQLIAQEKHTISGFVKDNETGEFLIGATVYIKETFKGVSTNQYGFYSLTVEEGDYTVEYSFLGLQSQQNKVSLKNDLRINISLESSSITTDVVIVESEGASKNIETTNMSQLRVDVKSIKKLPAFMGEVDVLKTIQLLPGVQSSGEGSSGFYVRGGGPDQNLILLDEATVYNASHLFGFFSVFNADAIKDINLVKGGMPAKYGGRLASVLDISMKEGNNKKFQVDGGLGLISSKLTLQGPIKKDTSSFIISGRRTYIDVLVNPLINDSSAFKGTGYYFFDLTSKVNYRISDNDRIFLSTYFGRDVFTFRNKDRGFSFDIPWGNATTSARWNHLFNDKLFVNTSVIFSDYNFSFAAEQNDFEFELSSGITDWNTKVDFSYLPNYKHTIKFGTQFIYHTFVPGSVSGRSGEVSFEPESIFKQYSNEGAIYLSDDMEITEELKIHAGLRYSSFQFGGPITFRNYLKNEFTQDTTNHHRHLEPRLSLRYKLDKKSSFKASYTQNYQYVHLASFSSVSLPTDLWIPSSKLVKPQYGRQFGLGLFRNFFDNKWETSIEAYHKKMDNLIEYKEGVFPEDNSNTDSDDSFTFGSGESYGLEFFIKKRVGKTTGWIGYTISKTDRLFPNLNNGNKFPAKYDRTHDLSVTATHELNDKWVLSAVFVYATGNTLTPSIDRYVLDGSLYTEFGDRNSYRMTPYHRMDISATYTKNKPNKKFNSSWNFSIYNIYNRANPYFIYFDLEGEGSLSEGDLEPKAFQISLFPIIPSVAWNFNF
ncbi:MAG: TonB-dependent receptor [Flavobacteriales bacterium]